MTYKTNKMLHLICNIKQNKAFSHIHAHKHTRTHTQTAAKPLLRHWGLVLANSPGGGLVPHRWGCAMSQYDGMDTQSPTWTRPISWHRQQFDICFPKNDQVPLNVTVQSVLSGNQTYNLSTNRPVPWPLGCYMLLCSCTHTHKRTCTQTMLYSQIVFTLIIICDTI